MSHPFRPLVLLSAAVLLAGGGFAAGTAAPGQSSYMADKRFLVSDFSAGRISIVEKDGSVSWTYSAPQSEDVQVDRAAGTVLFTAHHLVQEVKYGTTNRVLATKAFGKDEIYGVARGPGGALVLADTTRALLYRLDAKGNVARTAAFPADPSLGKPCHGFLRNIRVTADGHVLVAHYQGKKAVEYAWSTNAPAAGKPDTLVAVREFPVPGNAHTVIRTADGHTYVTVGDGEAGLYEFDAAGKLVWSVSNKDFPGQKPRFYFCAMFEILPNGNILLNNWMGHHGRGQAPQCYEITRDKKIVWSFEDTDAKRFNTPNGFWPL